MARKPKGKFIPVYTAPMPARPERPAPKVAPKALVDVAGTMVDAAAAPEDRVFRDAWIIVEDVIKVDMATAREIHRDRLRGERAPLLQGLDAAYMQALERGQTEDMQAISAQKKKLRDVTEDPRIAAASTPDELKALTLEILTK